MDMDGRCGLDSSDYTHGVQETYTDFDEWICRFNARLTSRLPTDVSTCKASTTKQHSTAAQKKTKDSTEFQPSSDATVPSQEILVNGLFAAQKRKVPKNDIIDFFNIFKTNDDFVNYDYVLMTLVNENGRKNLYKYIRSKIL